MKYVDIIIVKSADWHEAKNVLEDAGIEVFTQITRVS